MKKEQEKIPENEEQNESGKVSRRDFLVGTGTVVVGGVIGAGLLSSCKSETVTTTVKETSTKTVPTTITAPGTTVTETKTVAGEGGQVITVTETKTIDSGGSGALEPWQEPEIHTIRSASMQGVTGGDPMSVDIKNGKVIRCRAFRYNESYNETELAARTPILSAKGKTCTLRDRSYPNYFTFGYKHRLYCPNRVKYPLQRVDFDPNADPVTGRNTQNRGKSKYKRITWDKATDIIASEIVRIHKTYGTLACFIHSRMHGTTKTVHMCHLAHMNLLALYDHFSSYDNNPDSWEGWFWGGKHVGGAGSRGFLLPNANAWPDVLQNAEHLWWQAGDWETTPQQMGAGATPAHYFADDIGLKSIYITTELNYAAAVHAYKWVPILPNTDTAFLLAVIYVWITEDTYDKDYIATHTVGFEEFSKYVLGEVDGIPKTPEWASPKCGIPEWTIKALARQRALHVTAQCQGAGGSTIRGPYSSEPARMIYIALAMQGLGKPGVQQVTRHGFGGRVLNPMMESISLAGKSGLAKMITRSKQHIALTKVPEAIEKGELEWWGGGMAYEPVEDQFIKRSYPLPPEEGGTEIHMYWTDCPCMTSCWNEGNHWIDAFRNPKIEFMLVQHPWLEDDCVYADIILPGTTIFEDKDICSGGDMSTLWIQKAAIEHIGESKSDFEAVCEIAKKMEKYGEEYPEYKDSYNRYMGEWPTIDDRIKGGFDASRAEKYISWEDFNEKEYWIPEVKEGWEEASPGLRAFYLDPEKNPRDLPSGKLEITSERLRENFPDDLERYAYPTWVEGGDPSDGWAHDERIGGERSKKYPLLMVSNHPKWRHHSQCDDIPWFREIRWSRVKGYDGYMYEAVWINPTEAAKRGIVDGDIIKVYNERGICLGGARVTERVGPQTAIMDHGARIDMIADRIDRGGSNNLITPRACTSTIAWGQATSGFLVEIEKLDPTEMEEWKKNYPEAFKREYDPAYGLHSNSWIEGDEE